MGKNLAMKEARKEKGLSQDALAIAVGVSRQTINAIERATTTPPTSSASASAGCWN